MRVSWQQVLAFLFPKLLWLLVGLIGLTITAAALQNIFIGQQNLALQFNGKLGDFNLETVLASPTFTENQTLVATPNCLVVPTTSGELFCLEPKTGVTQWHTWLSDGLQVAPYFSDKYQLLLVPLHHGGLIAIDEKTGQTRWQYKGLTNFHWKQQQLSVDQNYWVALNTENQLTVFDVQSGKLIWQTSLITDHETEPKTQFFLHDDQLLVADSAAMTLTSLNVMTGENRWQQRNFTGNVAATIELASDLVWYPTNFYTWQGVTKDTGIVKAKLTVPSGSTITNAGSHLIFHDFKHTLFWFDAMTGASLGISTVAGQIQKTWFDQQLMVKLAEAPFAEKIAVFDLDSRQLIWQTESLDVISNVQSVTDKNMLITSQSGLLTWLNAETGALQAQSLTQETPVIVKPVKNTSAVWVITKHHGTYSSHKELNDIWFFSAPGKLQFQLKDLPLITATNLATVDRLWLVHQSQKTLVSFTAKAYIASPIFWVRHIGEKIKYKKTWQNFFEDFRILLEPSKHTLRVEQSVAQTSKGCVATVTLSPQSDIVRNQLQKPDFNPWQNVTVTTQLAHQNQVLATTNGYYFRPNFWRADLVLPNFDQPENVSLNIKFKLNELELSQTLPITVPALCQTDFLQLSEANQYWSLGLQDAFLDENQNGNLLDDWLVPQSATPNPLEKPTKAGSTEYLKVYAQAGFTSFRFSQDNFSFKNWLDFSDTEFHGSIASGLTTDALLRELRAQNYTVMFGLFGFDPETESAALSAYLDYCIARFGAWIDVWELSNEAWPDESWVNFVSTYLKAHDPYQHPITTNWDRAENPNIDIVNLHYYRSEPQQELTGEFLSTIRSVERYHKPIIFGEFGNSEMSWDIDSNERFRLKAWLSAWHRTPIMIWNQAKHQLANVPNANLYLGPAERATAEKLTGWLARHENIPLKSFTLKTNAPHYCAGLTDAATLILIYCTNRSGEPRSETFEPAEVFAAAEMPEKTGAWQIHWFDPASLKSKGQTRFSSQNLARFTTPLYNPDLVSEWRFEP